MISIHQKQLKIFAVQKVDSSAINIWINDLHLKKAQSSIKVIEKGVETVIKGRQSIKMLEVNEGCISIWIKDSHHEKAPNWIEVTDIGIFKKCIYKKHALWYYQFDTIFNIIWCCYFVKIEFFYWIFDFFFFWGMGVV